MPKNTKNFLLFIFVSISLLSSHLFSMRQSNRYFPFLETPQIVKRGKFGTFKPAFFYIRDSVAWGDNWGRIGIHELYGKYDLEDVINSLQSVTEDIDEQAFTNPFTAVLGDSGAKYIDKPIKYDLNGKLKAIGFTLKYEQDLPWKNTFLGAFLPVMHVISNQVYSFNQNASRLGFTPTSADIDEIDTVRRYTHEEIGFQSPDYTKTGFGDLDLYFRFRAEWEYLHLMHGINFNLKTGVLIPTGVKRDINNPAAVPFMGDGHIGWYLSIVQEFELKEDLRLGIMLGYLYQFKEKMMERMSVGSEPSVFSSLKGRLQVKPGPTLKIAPYLSICNIVDGLNVQLMYTHLMHNDDDLDDRRPTSEIDKLNSRLTTSEDLTRWRMNLFTMELMYDSKAALKKWPLEPIIYATFTVPFGWIGGKNAAKHHQFSLGVELNF